MSDTINDQDREPETGDEVLRPPDGVDPDFFQDLPEWGRVQILEWRQRRQQNDGHSISSMVANSTGFVNAFSSMRLFLVWIMWLSAGGFIALTAERSRQQRVPF